MTIERGRQWGEPGPLPVDGVTVRSDREARAVVESARRAGEPVPAARAARWRPLPHGRRAGRRGERLRIADAMPLPVDLGSVLIDGRLHWFVAHLVARRSWWRGRAVAAMNAQWLGDWDVAPRAHPNDGLLDTYSTPRLSLDDRLKARRRLRTRHPPAAPEDQRAAGVVDPVGRSTSPLDVVARRRAGRPGPAACRSGSSPTRSVCVV